MITNLRYFLGSEIDNSPLVVWRIAWGLLIFAEGVGAIVTGWVQEVFILPEFTFTFIGFEWLRPLPGDWMHVYYVLLALVGLMIAAGYRYRLASVLFFLMWTAVYFMQKSHYNNHYYLMCLMGFLMIWLPAHHSKSMDVRASRTANKTTCDRWHIWIFILLIGLIYVAASLNKMHLDWMHARPLKVWFSYKSSYPIIGPLLAKEWFAYVIAWGGILYDGLIFFLLLHPRTRLFGFSLSVIFNLFNSAVFQIGVFPYMMIASTVFFFKPDQIGRIFLRRKETKPSLEQRPMSPIATYVFLGFFLVNILLPLRHHLYPGDVHWTEEGHRLSWQMMLRAKTSRISFFVEEKGSGIRENVRLSDYLSSNQRSDFGGKPDMIWQFAQHLKSHFANEGRDVAVYARALVSLNGSKYMELIDPNVDLASVPWERFKHSDWILDENRPQE